MFPIEASNSTGTGAKGFLTLDLPGFSLKGASPLSYRHQTPPHTAKSMRNGFDGADFELLCDTADLVIWALFCNLSIFQNERKAIHRICYTPTVFPLFQ